MGARLSEWAGPRGVAGRLGGDEFAALARIEPRHQALRLEHLARLMTRPVPTRTGCCRCPFPSVPPPRPPSPAVTCRP
ncbi:hypothetical protein [Streptomyces sp. NBC_01768]|uniref:hypothetical protein n=1 Tax=Streptomyces sp. NBC_01768 TaxID=2975938 RepID=UPI002DD8194F|nr:hypothetical protein [Streptomyces sp. NBC_01768]